MSDYSDTKAKEKFRPESILLPHIIVIFKGICSKLNSVFPVVHNWFVPCFSLPGLKVKMQVDIVIGNQTYQQSHSPKYFGLCLITSRSFVQMVNQCKIRWKTERTSWSLLLELVGITLAKTYKAIGKPIAYNAVPICSPHLSTKLEWHPKSENTALRTITGCHVMSNQDHLHRETNIIPIKEHYAMLSKQYILSCHPPERNLRKYASREYKENIESFIPLKEVYIRLTKLSMKSIHTADVRSL